MEDGDVTTQGDVGTEARAATIGGLCHTATRLEASQRGEAGRGGRGAKPFDCFFFKKKGACGWFVDVRNLSREFGLLHFFYQVGPSSWLKEPVIQ